MKCQVTWAKRLIIVLLLYTLLPVSGGSSVIWSYSITGITALSVSESGDYIAVGCQNGFYYIFDTWGNLLGSGNVPAAVVSLDIADTGELLVGSSAGYTFYTKEGDLISSYLSYPVRTVSMSSDGTSSLACSQRNLYINQGTSMVYQLEVSDGLPFGAVSSDGTLACAKAEESVYCFRNGALHKSYTIEKEVEHLFVSKDGKKVTFATNKDVGYIDTETGNISSKDLGLFIKTMTTSPDGCTTLLSTANQLIWFKNGSILSELPIDSICCLSLSEDGSLAAVGKEDGTLQVITPDGTLIAAYDFESSPVALEISQDYLTVCTDTSISVVQFFQKTRTDTHFYSIPSRRSLPLTSPFEEVWSLPVEHDARFFTADMDGDGLTEIVLKEGTTITLLDEHGALKTKRDLEIPFSRLFPIDTDGNNIPEICIGYNPPHFDFSVYDWRDESMKDYYFDSFKNITSQGSVIPFTALDSDNDGEPEIVATVWRSYVCDVRGVIALDYVSGAIEWFYHMGPGIWPSVIDDIDGDGAVEIVVGSVAPCNCEDDEEYPDCEASVTALSGTGEELWKVSMGYGFKRAQVCADDICEDEGEEIIGFGYEASWNWGKLFILSCHGEYLYDFEVDYSIFPGAVGDIDGDGTKEIVALDSRGYISVFAPDLKEKSKKLIGESITQNSQVYVNDINGDGTCEILLVVEKGLFILDKDLAVIWEKEFEDDIEVALTYFSGCKNTLLVLSDNLYAFSYKDTEGPCPLWEVTERTLTEEGTEYKKTAESSFTGGEYRTSRMYFERALDIFLNLEDQEMIDTVSERIAEVSAIIFKRDVKMGTIFLTVFDGGLCVVILYYWISKKRWYRLAEGVFLLSLPFLLGLSQVYYASGEYQSVFMRYAAPSLVISLIIVLRQKVYGSLRTMASILSGHKDMLVLSIVRSDGLYRVSVESIEEKFNPVKESREIVLSLERRKNIIRTVKLKMGVLNEFFSGHTSSSYAEKALKETGTVIYEHFIPEDFSDILKAKFLLLEVEDTEIPWELMYADNFFAVTYGISRRIVSTEAVNVRPYTRKGGRRALIISDPLENLPDAQTECEIVYKRLKQKMEVVLVEGCDANLQRIANQFGQGFDIIHFAGHVNGGLSLADGVMTPEEVKEFITGTPVVFVNGCKSEELARAFLLGGAMAYVGTVHPIHDRSAAEIAADFYDFSLQYQIGEALRRARDAHITKDLVWASLVMYGDPTLKLL